MSVYFTASQNGFRHSWTIGENSFVIFSMFIIICYKCREQAFEVGIFHNTMKCKIKMTSNVRYMFFTQKQKGDK